MTLSASGIKSALAAGLVVLSFGANAESVGAMLLGYVLCLPAFLYLELPPRD